MSEVKSKRIALAALAVWAMAGAAEAQPYAYALGTAPLSLSLQLNVINSATNRIVAAVVLGRSNQGPRPQDMVMAPDGGRIYVINNLDYTVSVVSTRTNTAEDTWPQSLVGNSPRALAVSPDSRRLYVTNAQFAGDRCCEGVLVVIDIASRSRLATIPFPLTETYGVAVSPDGSRLYVVTETWTGIRAVKILSTTTYAVLGEARLSGAAIYSTLALSPDGRFVYLPGRASTSQAPGLVEVLDTTTNTIVTTTTVGDNPRSASVSPNGAVVYVATPTSTAGALYRLDPSTHASVGTIGLVSPIAVAFSGDSSRAYVAAVDRVHVVDTETHAVTATIPIPSRLLDNSVGNRIAAIVATPPPYSPPGSAPSGLRATAITGNRVTLAWTAPTSVSPTGYVVEGGVTPQQVIASVPTGSTATAVTLDVPTGAFYVRVRAFTPTGPTGPSNEIRIVVNVPQVPSAPTSLLGLANGADVALSWRTASAGGAATSFILDVSGALTTSVPVALGETFSYAGVPPGTYTFTVRAVNSAGASAASPPVTLTFPGACPGPPEAPTNLVVSRAGSQLSASWDPPGAGPAASMYVLSVTGALNLSLPMPTRSVSGVVPPGIYSLSVLAVNSCGPGVETPPQLVTVP